MLRRQLLYCDDCRAANDKLDTHCFRCVIPGCEHLLRKGEQGRFVCPPCDEEHTHVQELMKARLILLGLHEK